MRGEPVCNCVLNKAIISRYFHSCVGGRWKETEEKEELLRRRKNLIDLQDLTCYQSWMITAHLLSISRNVKDFFQFAFQLWEFPLGVYNYWGEFPELRCSSAVLAVKCHVWTLCLCLQLLAPGLLFIGESIIFISLIQSRNNNDLAQIKLFRNKGESRRVRILQCWCIEVLLYHYRWAADSVTLVKYDSQLPTQNW